MSIDMVNIFVLFLTIVELLTLSGLSWLPPCTILQCTFGQSGEMLSVFASGTGTCLKSYMTAGQDAI
jgi:hypothetical protein